MSGVYLSRQIGYRNVKFTTIEVPCSKDMKYLYKYGVEIVCKPDAIFLLRTFCNL